MTKEGLLKPGLALSADMGPIVLKHLQELVSLEPLQNHLLKRSCFDVVIAGQAVASAVNELFGDGSAVRYNDVDAFVLVDHNVPVGQVRFAQEPKPKSQVLTTLGHDQVSLAQNEYGHVRANTQRVYTVLATQREGLRNDVLCDYMPRMVTPLAYDAPRVFRDDDAQRFLRTFDLNCVQVGLRLSDKRLVWTPAFERFCATRELLVEQVLTPLHTAIRWFKKKAELPGVYGRDDWAMQLLAVAAARLEAKRVDCLRDASQDAQDLAQPYRVRKPHDAKGWLPMSARTFSTRLLFSTTYKGRLEGVSDKLAAYFAVKAMNDTRIPLFTLQATFDPGLSAEEVYPFPDGFLPTYVRAKQGFWRKHLCQKVLDVAHALRAPIYEQTPATVLKAQWVTHADPAQVLKETNLAMWKPLFQVTREHPQLARMARWLPFPVAASFFAELRAAARAQGDQVYGLAEIHLPRLAQALLARPTPDALVSADDLRAFFQVLEQENAEALRNARFLLGPGFKPLVLDGFRVRELRDVDSLLREGVRMRHCVGGYHRQVITGHTAILQLHKPEVGDCLTVELAKIHGGLRAVQVKGFRNREATPDERDTVDRLVLALRLKRVLGSLNILPLALYLRLAGPLTKPVSKVDDVVSKLRGWRWSLTFRAREALRKLTGRPTSWGQDIPF